MKKFNQKKMLNLGVFLLPALFLSSCAEDKFQEDVVAGNLGEQQALKDENLELWESQGITDYRFTFNWSCFFCDPYIQRVDITVVGGVIDSITVTENGEVLSPDIFDGTPYAYRTVDELFDWIQNEIESGPYFMAVTYDPDWGYPEEAHVDPNVLFADDDRIFFVFGLE